MLDSATRHLFRHVLRCSPRQVQLFHRRAVANKSNAGGTDDPALYCQDLVRKHDYEGFLVSFAYPAGLRNAYFALKAFNAELAMIPESTSQATIAQMRYQFWKDAVKAVYEGQAPQQPIALALRGVVPAVPAYHLLRMIDARVAEVTNPGFMSVDDLTAHAESTSSTQLYTHLSLLSLSSSSLYSHAASHIGIANSFATILRALPFQASKRRLFLPAELTAKHGVSQEDVFRHGGDAQGIDDAVYELASLAYQHISTARGMFDNAQVPREALPVFLSAIPTISYLQRLEARNFHAFEPKLQTRDWKLPYRVWQANRRSTF
ncbi:probable ribosomal protein MRP17, mitochondrial [Serendipita indica DSM 11827]|uniref:Probable ribosomal protein MRP17, mitochondrial n=1 Tax=Serendipita indica (strain DSM 11827) TaxID=1109443 RepID=G4TJJ3_SERID|nr:probable ribosomal protein MRP17, mitochondrial [Serendipita indica DSM 11827]